MTDAEKIAHLEAVIKNRDAMLQAAYRMMLEVYLIDEKPDEIRRRKAFIQFDAYMKETGLR